MQDQNTPLPRQNQDATVTVRSPEPESSCRSVYQRSELVSGFHVGSKETELSSSGSQVLDHCFNGNGGGSSLAVVAYNEGRRGSGDVSSGSNSCKMLIQIDNFTENLTIGIEGCKFSQREESGYALQIPEGSLVSNVHVTITVRSPDPETCFAPPEESEFVSGVFHMVSEETELNNNGSLVIDHCCNIRNAEDRDSLAVVAHNEGSRENDVSSGSNQARYVDDRDIDVRSGCVKVILRKLQSIFYAVVTKLKGEDTSINYCGVLYRLRLEADLVSPMKLKFFFVVVKDLRVHITAVEMHSKEKNLEKAYEPVSITFTPLAVGQEMKLALDLKQEGIRKKGWHIYPPTWPAEIYECDAHKYCPNKSRVPSLELQAVWEDKTQPNPERLVEKICIEGTARPKSFLLQYDPWQPEFQETRELNDNDPMVPTMTNLIKFSGLNGKYNIPKEIGIDYFNFGILLLDDKTGSTIQAIEWRNQRHSEAINREILCHWLCRKGRMPVQWATLIEVLRGISKHTLANDIECSLKER